jgi:alkaline phosphatase
MRRTLLALALLAAPACGPRTAVPETTPDVPVRNVILLIGDGMGPGQIGLLETWARLAPSSTYGGEMTAIAQLAARGAAGVSLTHPHGNLVVDSACSATQLATGLPAPAEVIGLDAVGNIVPTVLERARDTGRATGLVSDTRITHATPASFAAHVPHRRFENEIAEQLVASGVDVMLSGGLRYFAPRSVAADADAALAYTGGAWSASSRRADDRDLVAEARDAGYRVVFDRAGLDQARDADGRLLGLFANSGMRDALAARVDAHSTDRGEPTLAEMTRVALGRLERDPDGFFLMVEGGQIDWAGHDNDAGWMLAEMARFDEAVAEVLRWSAGREDTVVVLTADHETGGFGFSYSGHDVPVAAPLPGDGMAGELHTPQFNFGDAAALDVFWAQRRTLSAAIEAAGADATPARLLEELAATIDVALTVDDAEAVLAMEPNAYHVDGHEYLDAPEVPAIADFGAFYVYADGARAALVARAIAEETGAVWSNGTHTAAPVLVVVDGPPAIEARLDGITDHVALGALLNDLFR